MFEFTQDKKAEGKADIVGDEEHRLSCSTSVGIWDVSEPAVVVFSHLMLADPTNFGVSFEI